MLYRCNNYYVDNLFLNCFQNVHREKVQLSNVKSTLLESRKILRQFDSSVSN